MDNQRFDDAIGWVALVLAVLSVVASLTMTALLILAAIWLGMRL